jgi:hypothetical protein
VSKYIVTARLLVEADSERDAISAASEAIDLTRDAILDFDFCDVPMVEISEHQLQQRCAGYLDDAAKSATRH